MNKLIRVYKENEVYTFLKNKKQELILSMDDKGNIENSYTKIVEENVDEISAFVEDNRSIYLILKKEENLRCIILQEEVINTGKLYSYTRGNYRIYDSHMFIQGGSVNIIAILKSDSKEINDELIHYIYEGESVKKNILRSLNKNLNYRDYIFDMGSEGVNIYYIDKISSKEHVFARHLRGNAWSSEKKLYELQGEIQSIDVKKQEDNIYLAIVEKVASIFAIRVIILDKDLKICTQKIHYSVFQVGKVHIIEENDLHAMWEEDDVLYVTSPLSFADSIEIFKLDNLKVSISESYSVGKFSVINKKEALIKNCEGKVEVLNIEEILNEKLESGLDHSNTCKKDIELHKNICDNIVSLKDDISNKKECILNKLDSFSLTDNNLENYINELKIITAQKDKLEKDRLESSKLLELYEITIKENYQAINSKEDLINHHSTLLNEQELMIKDLSNKLQYERNKGIFKRMFKI